MWFATSGRDPVGDSVGSGVDNAACRLVDNVDGGSEAFSAGAQKSIFSRVCFGKDEQSVVSRERRDHESVLEQMGYHLRYARTF